MASPAKGLRMRASYCTDKPKNLTHAAFNLRSFEFGCSSLSLRARLKLLDQIGEDSAKTRRCRLAHEFHVAVHRLGHSPGLEKANTWRQSSFSSSGSRCCSRAGRWPASSLRSGRVRQHLRKPISGGSSIFGGVANCADNRDAMSSAPSDPLFS